MPQATVVSGVGATLEGRQQPDLGEQLVNMAEAFTRVKNAEQQQAQQKYKIMLDTMDKIPIDANELRKVAKKAGMPLPKDETIAAIAQVGREQKQQGGQQGGQKGGQPNNPGEARAQTAQGQPQGQQQRPEAAAAAATQKWQDGMTPEKGLQHVLDTWYARGQQLASKDFSSKMAKLEADEASSKFEMTATQMKTKAAGGDAEAMGWLQATGAVPFNLSQLAWANADPKMRPVMYKLAVGYDEGQNFRALLAAGKNPKDAYDLAHAMTMGYPLTQEQQKTAGGMSFKEIGEEASTMSSLFEAGVPSDQLGKVVAKARETGNLVGALPTKLQPILGQQLELQKQEAATRARQADTAEKRAGSEETRAASYERRTAAYESDVESRIANRKDKNDLALAKMRLDEVTGANKQYLDSLKILIQQKKNGVSLDPKETQKILDGLRTYTEDPQGTLDYLTGSSSVAPGGDPLEDELGGGSQPKPSAGKQ